MSEELQDIFSELAIKGWGEDVDKIRQEIERLTELCNKYEEEHKTTFETWQKDINEIERLKIQVSARETEYERLHSIIREVREVLENKREKMTNQLLYVGRCDYEELLYQVDEEIGRILDKVEEK